jgi:agmatine deiminase
MTISSISSYRMPAEWHPHSSTLLSWPVNPETWPEERLERVEKVYLQIIKALADHEKIHLLVDGDSLLKRVTSLLTNYGVNLHNIEFHNVTCNDVWARDFGPIFIRNEASAGTDAEFAITDWGYNAWGGKYPPFDDDNAIPKYFADKFDVRRFEPGMILEGGSIETNGDGVMLVTESVLLNPNRNPELSKQQIEANLKYWLGQDKVIWLGRGLEGDDTDGHIDDLSRFLNKNTILTMTTDDPYDVNFVALQENLNILKSATDQYGNSFKIETLPMPITKIEGTTVDGSEFVPASYANYYVANGVVLLPLYDERYDDLAIELMSKYFPDRKVVGIDCRNLVWGQGSIHCITQQMYRF